MATVTLKRGNSELFFEVGEGESVEIIAETDNGDPVEYFKVEVVDGELKLWDRADIVRVYDLKTGEWLR
jgi:hypothetical protein